MKGDDNLNETERQFKTVDVQAIHLRGADGDLAVLAGHVPFITSVKPCKCVVVLSDGTQKEAVTDGGVLTVSSDITTLISGSFHW